LTVLSGQPSFIKYFELDTRKDATDLEASMNGLFQTGGVVGTLLLPIVADKWGRKMGIALVSRILVLNDDSALTNLQSAVLIIISAAVMAGSTNIGEFIFFRFMSGAGAFMILAAVPVSHEEVT
jgi:MFS family permease